MASPSSHATQAQAFNGLGLAAGSGSLLPPRLAGMGAGVANPLAGQMPGAHNALFSSLAADSALKSHPYPSIPITGLNSNPFNGLCRQVAAGVYPSLLTNGLAAGAFNNMFGGHLPHHPANMGTHNSFQSLLATLSSLYGTHPPPTSAAGPFPAAATSHKEPFPALQDASFPLKPTVNNGSPRPRTAGSPLCLVKEGDRSPDFRTSSINALRQKAIEHELSMSTRKSPERPESK